MNRPIRLLTQNAKMKKSGGAKFLLYNFGIPALQAADGTKTCPNAGACAVGCYARQGAYVWPKVKAAYEARFQLSKQDPVKFEYLLNAEIYKLKVKAKREGKRLVVRIHDAGDFYSKEYFDLWLRVVRFNPDALFYAYTKQVKMLQDESLPANFKLNFSFGGRQDAAIRQTSSNARVFETRVELARAGYVDTSEDDSFAFSDVKTRKIGLVYHGVKSFAKTSWGRV